MIKQTTKNKAFTVDHTLDTLTKAKRKANLDLSYRRPFAKLAFKFALLGVDNAAMAKLFNVTPKTLELWRKTYIQFDKAIVSGRESADAEVVLALFNRAIGTTQTETVSKVIDGELKTVELTKEILPDVIAQKHWLSSRRPDEWRENTSVNVDVNLPMYKPQIHSFDGEVLEDKSSVNNVLDEYNDTAYTEPLNNDDIEDLKDLK